MSQGTTAIAILYYPAKTGAAALAHRFAAEIPRIVHVQACALSLADTGPAALHGVSLALVIGGDGSILSAARLCAPLGLPLLPIQMGRLGALAELETHEVEALVPYLHGDCYRDERLMLTATIDYREVLALNEVVVARGLSAGPLRVVVTLGERPYATVWADALIVATPTGSTAYTYSAGGPVVHPEVACLSLTAVAPQAGRPHLLLVPPDERITLAVETEAPTWMFLADGQVQAQPVAGTRVCVQRAAYRTVFLRRGDRYRLQRRLRALLVGNPRPGAAG
jgi:NAD+ kinase